MQSIQINVFSVGVLRDIALFRVGGYVDTSTSPELQRSINQVIREGRTQIIIDLGAVQYVSSAGWGVFVAEIRELREKGGDLKIVQMAPDVIEVFEMLEFNRILENYDSLEEAVFDFDLCRGIDLTAASAPELKPISVPEPVEPKARIQPEQNKDVPLVEKVKQVVLENPRSGAWAIKKRLNTPEYGNTKVSFFRVRSLLKILGLDSRARRQRFFRSR